jgi:hypothetical protein
VFDSKTYSISNNNIISTLEGLLNGQVGQLISHMVVGSTVSYPFLFFNVCIRLCNHSNKLSRWVPSLVRVVHPVEAVQGLMAYLATDLRRCSGAGQRNRGEPGEKF